ncbi:MAG: hypothetical protein HOQ02_12115 [Lysobacter sp.]|nr:hypothetical protein [Lysobacter sp.]
MQRPFATFVLAAALAGAVGSASAQEFVFGWNPRSGDVWVDTQLADINRYGERYRDPFIDEMTRYYGAPRDLVSDLLLRRHWAPGDVYFACALAQAAGRPCRYVVDEWERDHGQGWGALAQRMGIKPGSAEFHRLKRGFVPSFDRWGRPVRLDASLAPDFPGRGNPHDDEGGNPGRDKASKAHGGKGHGRGHDRGDDDDDAPPGLPWQGDDDTRGNGNGHGNGGGHGRGHG